MARHHPTPISGARVAGPEASVEAVEANELRPLISGVTHAKALHPYSAHQSPRDPVLGPISQYPCLTDDSHQYSSARSTYQSEHVNGISHSNRSLYFSLQLDDQTFTGSARGETMVHTQYEAQFIQTDNQEDYERYLV